MREKKAIYLEKWIKRSDLIKLLDSLFEEEDKDDDVSKHRNQMIFIIKHYLDE